MTANHEELPFRRLHRGRLLAATATKYHIQFCFTGFGQKSIKSLNKEVSDPDIKNCADLYPDDDPYSLKNLAKLNTN